MSNETSETPVTPPSETGAPVKKPRAKKVKTPEAAPAETATSTPTESPVAPATPDTPVAPAPETKTAPETNGRNKVVRALLGDKEFAVTLLPQIEREALHGKSTLKPMKGDQTLKRAYLRPNGQIVRNQDRKLTDTDPEGSLVEKATKLGAETEVALVPSITETGMKLQPGNLTDLAEFVANRFLPIEVVGLAKGLYHTTYNLRATTTPEKAILVVKDNAEAFLIIGEARKSTFVGDIPNYEFFGTEEEEETSSEESGDDLAIGF